MAVWVRLPGLPVEYFRNDVLKLILGKVGTPLKLDMTTAAVERGRFARAAVEIDLTKPLVSMVWIHNRIQRVEFEALHVVCFECGDFGHRAAACDNEKQKDKEGDDDPNATDAVMKENESPVRGLKRVCRFRLHLVEPRLINMGHGCWWVVTQDH